MKKLTNLVSEVFSEAPKVNKHKVIEGVSRYGAVGKSLYSENNLVRIAEDLVKIAESAHSHIIGEQGDWFDKVTVNKNMKALQGQVKEFKVVANEANAVNQRLTSLYEDMGHILNRYYDISEINEDAGDMDKDGVDEPDSEEYMDNKDKAIQKAMKETWESFKTRKTVSLKDAANVVGLKAVGGVNKK